MKISEGHVAIGGLILLGAWLLIGLPLLYLPAEPSWAEPLGVKRGEWLLFFATLGLWYATWRLVKGADQTAERQLRAYVGIEKASVTNLDEEGLVEATLSFLNAGATPAYKLHSWGGMSVRAYPGPVDLPPPARDLSRVRESLVLPDACFFRKESGNIPNSVKADIIAGRATLFVYGEVHYIDAFGRKRFLYYRHFCGGGHPNLFTKQDGKTVGRLTPHDSGNDAN